MKHRSNAQRQYDDELIVRMREHGLSREDTAKILGVGLPIINEAVTRLGIGGKYRVRKYKPRVYTRDLIEAIREFGVVTIEDGLNGGFIVTVGDEARGQECAKLPSALKSAQKEAYERGN